ncbi:MAG: hypothetical protein ACK4FZ_03035 [Vogesella sp.]|uniref:hypothetical protein n=1 Tax=Vogesella sp. TaxID=1904252 RepID=UPI00391B4954
MVTPHARWALIAAIVLLVVYLLIAPAVQPSEQQHAITYDVDHNRRLLPNADSHVWPSGRTGPHTRMPLAVETRPAELTHWTSLKQIASENLQLQRPAAKLGPALALHALDSDRLISSQDPIAQLSQPAQRWQFLVSEQQQVAGLLQVELEHDGQAEAGRLGMVNLARALQQSLNTLPGGLAAQHWTHVEETDAYFVTARQQPGGALYFHPLSVSGNTAWQQMAIANQAWFPEVRFRELLRSTVLQSRNAGE